MSWGEWDAARRDRLAWVALGAAMLAAALLLLWEGRGQALFVDEWSFGYLGRAGFSLHSLLEPDNGHLAAVPVLIAKASLELFGAGTALPLRLVAIATHLAIALILFVILRRPAPGPPVPLGVRRFGDAFLGTGEALGGQATEIRLPPVAPGREWTAQLLPKQPVVVCALSARRSGGGGAK